MEPRIHVITLAVSDLEQALDFYRTLGLESSGVIGTEFTGDDITPSGRAAMFELEGGLTLALYPRTELAKDANVPFGPPKAGEFSIGQLVANKTDVDALLAKAKAAGATLTDAGVARLTETVPVHLRGVKELFIAQLDEQELAALKSSLDKVVVDCTFG